MLIQFFRDLKRLSVCLEILVGRFVGFCYHNERIVTEHIQK